MDIQIVSDLQTARPVGTVLFLGRRNFSAGVAHFASGEHSGLYISPRADQCRAQILITWQFGHNLLGTVGLYTHNRYSPWVTVSICWVSFEPDLTVSPDV